MQFVQTRIQNHPFFMLDVNQHISEVEWALRTAYLKTNNTIDTWQNRSQCKRFTNLFLGDLAKNLFKTFIINQRPQYENFIVEYDLIRSDEFRNRDEFDLKIVNNGQECNIEVKSSGEKYSNNINSLLSRRIIINFGNQHQHFECAAVQVMFVPSNLTFFQNEDFNCENFDEFVNSYKQAFNQQNISAYIVGFATEEMQRNAVNQLFNVSNQQANTNTRNYADLQIENSMPMTQFLNSLDNFFL